MKTPLETLIYGAVIAACIMTTAIAKADDNSGLVVAGSINKNLDTVTDYQECNPGGVCKAMRGTATLKVGYEWEQTGESIDTAIFAGVYHESNPFTPNDYGMNGLFVEGRAKFK